MLEVANSSVKREKQTEAHISLPDSVWALQPLVDAYLEASRRYKVECEWHRRCVGSPNSARWRHQLVLSKDIFELGFSGSAANAYSSLFVLPPHELLYCPPSRVMKISGLAGQLVELIPSSYILPGYAQGQYFQQGLTDLHRWRPSDLPEGMSARGNTVRRWMIRKIAEELYFSFAQHPSVGVVGDLIRLGWQDMTDRSIRNTLTETLLSEVTKSVEIRRKNDNNATTIMHQAITKASQEVNATIRRGQTTQGGDPAILAEMERLAASLADEYSRNRALSFLRATRDEIGIHREVTYPQPLADSLP